MEARELPVACRFGMEGMKQLKVCPCCSALVSAPLRTCPDCGGRLPQRNLFQLYQQNHRLCPECDTVLSDGMKFCHHCGREILIQAFSEKKGRNRNMKKIAAILFALCLLLGMTALAEEGAALPMGNPVWLYNDLEFSIYV